MNISPKKVLPRKLLEDAGNTLAFLNEKIGGDILCADYSKVITSMNSLTLQQKQATLAVCIKQESSVLSRAFLVASA